jgi:general secretion pathway protein F
MATNFHDPLPYRVRAALFLHLATMEKAGLPILKSFASLRLPGGYQKRLDDTRKMLARGADLASGGQRCGLFTPMEAALLRAAQMAGSPAAMYRRLANNYEKKVLQIEQIKSRMAMPVLVLTLALLIQPLPLLIAGTLSIGAYLWQTLSVLLLLGAIAYLVQRVPAWIQRGEPSASRTMALSALTAIPLFGPMHVRRNVRDFFESLALLLEAGVPMFDALPIAVASIDNGAIGSVFSTMLPRLKTGSTLSEALEGMPYLDSDSLIPLVQTGESSGTLPEMLTRHVNMESANIDQFQQELTQWLPRIFYGLVTAWMAYQMLGSNAFMPNVPTDL